MLESLARLDEIGARRPGEVVHVFLVVAMGGRAVRVVGARLLAARRGERPAARNRHAHVVHPEIRKELGPNVKLVAVPPAGRIEHADFRKPLRDEEVVADRAGARERARNPRRKRDVEGDRLSRTDRRRQRHCHHRAVVLVAVVGRDEAHLPREIGRRERAARYLQARDVDRGEVFVATRCDRLPPRREPCSRIHVESAFRHAL